MCGTLSTRVEQEASMASTGSNPFRGFLDMMSEMDRMRWLAKYGPESGYEEQARAHRNTWVPAADIYASGADLVIRVELADVRSEDIDIFFADGVLTVSGHRSTEPEGEVTFYTRELYYGPFRRSMVLPDDVDESRISASFRNGVAEVTVRGAHAPASSAAHRIPIRDVSDQVVPLTGRGHLSPD